jgi:hypothetical protein
LISNIEKINDNLLQPKPAHTPAANIEFVWSNPPLRDSIIIKNLPWKKGIIIKDGDILSYISSSKSKIKKYIIILGFKHNPISIIYQVYVHNSKMGWRWEGVDFRTSFVMTPYNIIKLNNLTNENMKKEEAEEAAESA